MYQRRLPSNAGLSNKVADMEMQAEAIVVLNPEKAKEQVPEDLSQGKTIKEKGQQFCKDASVEKAKETNSSHC
ncbi:UNVERIFIED_CONTAM: hypothetical protein K2H54_043266 [Gekko kuhli]